MAAPADSIAAPDALRLRRTLEHLVERAIELLDALDGDPDLEDGDEDAEHDGREPEDSI